MTLFSIIVPAYNVRNYLRQALNSVKNQTFTDWECICVDDGSTDGSGSILDEYALNDSRFKAYHKNNGGVASARNYALERSSGKWILFLDGDDLIYPYLLSQIRTVAEDGEPCDIIKFDISYQYEQGEIMLPKALPKSNNGQTVVYDDLSKRIRKEYFEGCFSRYAYRNDIVKNLKFPEFVVGEDLAFMTDALIRARTCAMVRGGGGYLYRLRGGSCIRSNMTQQKVIDGRRFAAYILNALNKSGKQIDRYAYHYYGVKCIEGIGNISDLVVLEREKCWDAWNESIRSIKEVKCLSFWHKSIVRIYLLTKWRWFAYVFCVVPYRLKLMGLNRGMFKRILIKK